MIMPGQYVKVPAGVHGAQEGEVVTVISTDMQDDKYRSVFVQTAGGNIVRIMPQVVGVPEIVVSCYVSYNHYDHGFEVVHEGGHLDAHCPAKDVLARDLDMLEAEASHP